MRSHITQQFGPIFFFKLRKLIRCTTRPSGQRPRVAPCVGNYKLQTASNNVRPSFLCLPLSVNEQNVVIFAVWQKRVCVKQIFAIDFEI